MRNTGDTVEEYQLSVLGPLSRFCQFNPDKLRLFPGDEGSVTITVKVPRTPEVLAGPTPFGIRVVPREHPELSDVAEGTVTVTPFGDLRAEMNPVTVRGRLSALLRFTVNNRGNAPLEIRLVGRDDEDRLLFDERESSTLVPAGVVGTPVLRVRPRRRRLTGKPQRYPFAVTVTPPEDATATGAKSTQLRGTYVQMGLFPKWLLVLLGLLLVAALIAAGLLYLPFTNLQARLFPSLALPSFQVPSVQVPPLSGGLQATTQQPPPPTRQQAPPTTEQQQQQQQQQGSGNSSSGGTDVTITHSDVALTAAADQRGGPPLVESEQLNQQQERLQTWSLIRLQDGSMAIVPVAGRNFALGQPVPSNNSQLALRDVANGQLLKNEAWFLKPAGSNDVVTIVNAQTGSCLTDIGTGQLVQARECESRSAAGQEWQLTAAS